MLKDAVLAEIDSVLAEYEEVEKTYKKPSARPMGGDYVDPPRLIASRIVTTLDAAIKRLSPPHSTYIGQADSVLLHQGLSVDASNTIRDLAGILQAIRLDYAGERTKRFEELVHCDMFADLLEAAEYLMEKFSKDPAAVMVGGVLEQHLRELCRKHGIDTTSANRKAKMIDAMNTDLAKQAVYNTIEQKLVTGWAGLRNAAAHGNFGEYDTQQVKQMIAGIREFIIRHPA